VFAPDASAADLAATTGLGRSTAGKALARLEQAGKVRRLAVTSEKRVPGLPDLPSVSETVPGVVMNGWFALVAPAGTRTVPVPSPVTVEIKGQTQGLIIVPQSNQAWPPVVQISQADVPSTLQGKVSSAWFVASVP